MKRLMPGVLLAICVLPALGCHHVFGDKTVAADTWTIEHGAEATVVQRLSRYPGWAGPELTFSDMVLEVRSGTGVAHRRTLARREGHEVLKKGPLGFRDLEMRCSPDHRQLWIVDRESSSVLGSHDRTTRATTGMGEEPPPWTATGDGIVLEPRG